MNLAKRKEALSQEFAVLSDTIARAQAVLEEANTRRFRLQGAFAMLEEMEADEAAERDRQAAAVPDETLADAVSGAGPEGPQDAEDTKEAAASSTSGS